MELTPRTLEKLKFYIGKTVTIMTAPTNRRTFTEQQSREYYTTIVQEIGKDGVWGVHPQFGNVAFYAMSAIQSIHEEVALDPNNPEHAKLLQEYYDETGKVPVSDVSPHKTPELPIIQREKPAAEPTPAAGEEEVPFVDINNLAQLARQTKKNYDNYEKVQKALNS